MAPLFLLIVLATADIVRVFRAQIRLEMIAVQIGQIVSQCTPNATTGVAITTPGDTSQFWTHAARIGGGLIDIESTSGGAMMITAVSNNNNANRMNWRVRTGNTTTQSVFGAVAVGGAPSIIGRANAAFVVPTGQTMLVTEVYGMIIPWTLGAGFMGTAPQIQLSALTMFLTRSSEPVRLQATPTNSAARECT